jgi:hypothetical protein
MASLWNQDSDSDSDTDTPDLPPGVDPAHASCIHTLKWKLYQAIVLGPESNTPEAQQNELLQKYIEHLERLYHLLDKAMRGSVRDVEVRTFPASLRHEILTCALRLKGLNKGGNVNHAADVLPYQDFLKGTLRMYPFVHHAGGGDAQSVEAL